MKAGDFTMHVLIVEDEPEMAHLLARGLREEQFEISLARDGRSALQKSSETAFDVILLDVMLPQMDGLEVARQLRRREQETPVLMLTARDSLPDIVSGLDAGADDYLTKPFSFVELLARIRALARRQQLRRKNVMELADLVLDVSSLRTFRKGQEIHLSHTEYRLLELLVRNSGRVVSRHEIQCSSSESISVPSMSQRTARAKLIRRPQLTAAFCSSLASFASGHLFRNLR